MVNSTRILSQPGEGKRTLEESWRGSIVREGVGERDLRDLFFIPLGGGCYVYRMNHFSVCENIRALGIRYKGIDLLDGIDGS